ncbi:hypothetical protein [Kineococcus sp. SYSU DK003]|uniref:hypothetical protein n=1 Tax=Kineococcus sp. SYSU DK003 TaxID=3383124 RepID=UPI003D7CC57D
MTTSDTDRNSDGSTAGDAALQTALDAVAARAATIHQSASAQDWQRHQQRLTAAARRRRRSRLISGGLGAVAASALVAAGLSWAPWSGEGPSVRIVPAGPTTAAVSDDDAQVHPVAPAGDGELPDGESSSMSSMLLPQQFIDLADDCAQQFVSAGPGGRRGGGGYTTVFAARSALTQAVGIRDNQGRDWLCSHLPGAQVAGQVISGDGGPKAVSESVATGGPGVAADGSVFTSFFGYASPQVAAVTVTTPDGVAFPAVVANGMWWASPRTPDQEAAAEIRWEAVDADGVVIAGGGPA